jgi:hypothetical protein
MRTRQCNLMAGRRSECCSLLLAITTLELLPFAVRVSDTVVHFSKPGFGVINSNSFVYVNENFCGRVSGSKNICISVHLS